MFLNQKYQVVSIILTFSIFHLFDCNYCSHRSAFLTISVISLLTSYSLLLSISSFTLFMRWNKHNETKLHISQNPRVAKFQQHSPPPRRTESSSFPGNTASTKALISSFQGLTLFLGWSFSIFIIPSFSLSQKFPLGPFMWKRFSSSWVTPTSMQN